MKDIILLIWGALIASGWWIGEIWGVSERGLLVAVAIFTWLLSIVALIYICVILATNWDD